MKFFFLLAWFALSLRGAFACDHPVNPKKIVLYMGFHGAGEELAGAREGACRRGETLLTFPPQDFLEAYNQKVLPSLRAEEYLARADRVVDNCIKRARAEALKKDPTQAGHIDANQMCLAEQAASNEASAKYVDASDAFAKWIMEHKPKQPTDVALKLALEKMKSTGATITALVISGHDGGGNFYGETDGITKQQVFALTSEYPGELGKVNTLLLMGCWSAVSEEIDEWKTAMPSIKILGGFVGSAPASTRIAGRNYIADTLTAEHKVELAKTQADVKALMGGIRDLNTITSGLYVDLTKCGSTDITKDEKDFYFVSPAQNESQAIVTPGLHSYQPTSSDEAKLRCQSAFQRIDWVSLDSFFSGRDEPEDNSTLRGLYGQLRNGEQCYRLGYGAGRVTPDQVLMLRFFQDVKKNFNKYYSSQMAEAYKQMDSFIEQDKVNLSANVLSQIGRAPRLMGTSLLGLNRQQTLRAISSLEGFCSILNCATNVPKLARMLKIANTDLYSLRCMDPTWHEYIENVPLVQPTCEGAY